jgi:cytochrome c biogenesis protein CcdA/thiol-disulfide isomerase/thioredoxin
MFSFLAGIVTILSPCILPVLPIVLSTTFSGGRADKSRPFGVIVGFVGSFTLFTLFLSTLVELFHFPADALRLASIIIVLVFGVSLLIPQFQILLEQLFARATSFFPPTRARSGFWGEVVLGLSLGLLWTPCVGPILGSVIALAVTGTINFNAFLITFAYALGTGIPLYLVLLGGQKFLPKNGQFIQRLFGVVMIATAFGLFFTVDRRFQSYILTRFPAYGTGLTRIEDNSLVHSQLSHLSSVPNTSSTQAPVLTLGGEWFNSDPLTLASLRGKVVLLDFWTYSCINCQRTLPYLKSWYAKYHDKGLVIIGIHSPEFEFEKNPHNVQQAIKDFGITYPVMQDNNFATWKSYQNEYWPAEYLIDKNGAVRHTHFGEGEYDGSEKMIQDLLAETGVNVSNLPISNPPTPIYANTPETYLGSLRNGNPDYLSYTGHWVQSPEYTTPAAGSTLTLQFVAKNVYLVMGNLGKPGLVKVFVDNVYTQTITVDGDKLYPLVELTALGAHSLRLEFQDNHIQAFAFTFG